ncbi:hypothetical protein [Actinoplanes sp. NPDC049265]|uniref:hypothetical protein n=1 Tax=Actinoplanes sp. NPDC049265 TaxID=3363902 RepID=UPI00371A41ED
MGPNDKQHQFDEIVARLVADYPSLAGRRPWSRRTRIVLGVAGGVGWGFLSVAMVAWGAAGVVLTCAVVGAVAAAGVYRRRR